MLDELKEYKFIKKSKYDLACDKVTNNIMNDIMKSVGFYSAYYLGIIQYLKLLIESAGENGSFGKHEFLMLIDGFKTNENISDDIKDVIDSILKEYDYKNKTPKYRLGDKFHIDYTEPLMDGKVFTAYGDYKVFKIDTISYKSGVFYYLRCISGTDEILVRQDILDDSKRIN